MQTKGGDEQMEGKEMEGYDYVSECLDKLDSMIENPKLATPEALMEVRDKLANEGEMEQEEEPMEESSEKKPSLVIAIGDAMKKGMKLLILGLFGMVATASICSAENLTRADWDNTRYDLYRSTVVNKAGSFAISTYPVIIGSIDCSSAVAASYMNVYDSTATNFNSLIG